MHPAPPRPEIQEASQAAAGNPDPVWGSNGTTWFTEVSGDFRFPCVSDVGFPTWTPARNPDSPGTVPARTVHVAVPLYMRRLAGGRSNSGSIWRLIHESNAGSNPESGFQVPMRPSVLSPRPEARSQRGFQVPMRPSVLSPRPEARGRGTGPALEGAARASASCAWAEPTPYLGGLSGPFGRAGAAGGAAYRGG